MRLTGFELPIGGGIVVTVAVLAATILLQPPDDLRPITMELNDVQRRSLAAEPPIGGGRLNCDQIGRPIHVTRRDPHRLDGDNDGVGCEEYLPKR